MDVWILQMGSHSTNSRRKKKKKQKKKKKKFKKENSTLQKHMFKKREKTLIYETLIGEIGPGLYKEPWQGPCLFIYL